MPGVLTNFQLEAKKLSHTTHHRESTYCQVLLSIFIFVKEVFLSETWKWEYNSICVWIIPFVLKIKFEDLRKNENPFVEEVF